MLIVWYEVEAQVGKLVADARFGLREEVTEETLAVMGMTNSWTQLRRRQLR